MLACTIRESLELQRNPIRPRFALFSTTFLMLLFRVIDELDRGAKQPAVGVNILLLDPLREQRRPAVESDPAGLRDAIADLDRIAGLNRRHGRVDCWHALQIDVLVATIRAIRRWPPPCTRSCSSPLRIPEDAQRSHCITQRRTKPMITAMPRKPR